MDVRLWQYTATLRHHVSAADERHEDRRHLFIELNTGEFRGTGEISPQPLRQNGDPSCDEVLEELQHHVLPTYLSRIREEGSLVPWSRVGLLGSSRRASLFALSGLEMAALDLEMNEAKQSLGSFFEEPARHVSYGATWSIIEPDNDWSPPSWCERLRVKTRPGIEVEKGREKLEAWGLPVVLDFNCSCSTNEDVLQQVDELAAVVDVLGIEQPFAPSDLVAHADLRSVLSVLLSLDESVTSLGDVRRIAQYGAADMVCVKLARVGGLISARGVIDEAKRHGLRHYVGGFFDTPLARSFSEFLAAITNAEASDVGPVSFEGSTSSPEISPQWWINDLGVGPSPDFSDMALLGTWKV